MRLILLFALLWLSLVLAIIENEHTTASVLPYILKRPNQRANSQVDQVRKHYTLLTAATSPTQPPHENAIDESEENQKADNVALAKIDFTHSWPHGTSDFNGHNGHDLWNDVYKYYYATVGAGSDARPQHGYGGANAPTASNAPSTVLLLINLGVLSYIVLAIVGALGRLLNIGAGLNAPPLFNHNNMGAGQYGFWRTANDNLLKKKSMQADE